MCAVRNKSFLAMAMSELILAGPVAKRLKALFLKFIIGLDYFSNKRFKYLALFGLYYILLKVTLFLFDQAAENAVWPNYFLINMLGYQIYF